MAKYKTKPKDYTGCHPVIEEHLRRGLSIYCEVWDKQKAAAGRQFITDYKPDETFPYKTDKNIYLNAEPIPIEQKIMPPERALPILFAASHHFNGDGDLVDKEGENILFACNLHFFGKSLSGAPTWFNQHPETLEETP